MQLLGCNCDLHGVHRGNGHPCYGGGHHGHAGNGHIDYGHQRLSTYTFWSDATSSCRLKIFFFFLFSED